LLLMHKIDASASQLPNCILLHAYSRTTNYASINENIIIAYLLSWHNNIFDYKLTIIVAENR